MHSPAPQDGHRRLDDSVKTFSLEGVLLHTIAYRGTPVASYLSIWLCRALHSLVVHFSNCRAKLSYTGPVESGTQKKRANLTNNYPNNILKSSCPSFCGTGDSDFVIQLLLDPPREGA